MSADFGGIAIRPGPFHERATGMGIASFGEGPLPASLTAGILRGDETQEFRHLSGVIEAGEVSPFRHGGHGHGKLDATQGLERFDDRMQPPGFGLVLELLFETPQAFRVFVDGADLFLKDHVLSGGGTDHLSEPPEVGRAPGGTARVADIVPEQEGVETALGRLEVP